MNRAKLIIWGCGGMGREILALCEVLGREVIGYLDERIDMHGRIVDDIPVLGDITHIAKHKRDVEIICTGVGDPALKRKFVSKTREAGFRLAPALVHPSVDVPSRSRLGMNSIILAGSVVSINVNIGDFVIINTNVTLAHDVFVADYCTISPGVNISGNVKVEEGAFVGTGSAIREKLTIGAWSMVGGGSFVKNDVPTLTLYAGVPAVYKKSRINS